MKYGLIGEKLGHSFSREIHNRFGKYDYELKELKKEELDKFFLEKDFLGLNVTIPYKQAVMPYLDEISFKAQSIGAVNTILNKNGKLYGYNTDYFGFNYTLSRANINVEGKVVAVLGTGGASKMACQALKDNGAKEIIVVSRSGSYNYQNLKDNKEVQIIINASPAGMYPNNGECLVDLNNYPDLTAVVDMVYNPYITEILHRGRDKGIKCVNGLAMLVAQAKRASEIFTGEEISDEITEKIISEVRKQTLNITLVGMPGCGKTTLGRLLAEKLERDFIDADEAFKTETGFFAGDYITTFGEPEFRRKESEILSKILRESRKVISTGGGAVKLLENRKNIISNSVTVWIKRDLSLLSTDDRPLSKSPTELSALYAEREKYYNEVSDFSIENDGNLQSVLAELIDKLKEYDGSKI